MADRFVIVMVVALLFISSLQGGNLNFLALSIVYFSSFDSKFFDWRFGIHEGLHHGSFTDKLLTPSMRYTLTIESECRSR